MYYTGKLTAAELYDRSTAPYTNVREVWDNLHNKHPGRCIVTNAHWHNPGPEYIGNYKIKGRVLSEDYDRQAGFGWKTGDIPHVAWYMDGLDNFVSTIIALISGERQWLDYGAGVCRSTTRTWLGIDKSGKGTVEVTTDNYTLDGIVSRMESLGIYDGMVFDGSGASQWYDGENYIDGDGRTIYSYLLLWFEDAGSEPEKGDGMTYKKGIDVSKWQGAIDWEKAKADGVEFAMLRAGYGQTGVDEYFERNAQECTRLGIPFGVYWFSYAYNTTLAEREAERCIKMIEKYEIAYPVAWDYEYDSYNHTVKNYGFAPGKTLISDMARAFLEKIKAAGYYPALYANPDYLTNHFDDDVAQRYDIWLAQWPAVANPNNKPTRAGGLWQYTSSGSVAGINGRVDMNYAYYDYPAIIGQPAEPNPEPEPEPEEPEKEDKPMTWQEEQQAATEWVKSTGISDGERPEDSVKRVELWVTLWRMFGKNGGK